MNGEEESDQKSEYHFYTHLESSRRYEDLGSMYGFCDNLRFIMDGRDPIKEKNNPILSGLQKETSTKINDTLFFLDYLILENIVMIVRQNEPNRKKGIYINVENDQLFHIYEEFQKKYDGI